MVVTSIVIVRRRLRYETWYFVHLYAYLGVALAFSPSSPPAPTSSASPGAAYWIALYVVTLAIIVGFRLGQPLARSLWHRLHVERVVEEGPAWSRSRSAASASTGAGARAGQFFTWRFLTRDRWWEAHPFSLSAAPDGRRLRITVKGLGDYTARAPARSRPARA